MTKFEMRRVADGMYGSAGKLYPVMQTTGSVSLETMSVRISERCTLTPADVKATVVALVEEISLQMAQGRVVDVEGLGRFRASLKVSDRAEEEKEDGSTGHRTSKSVEVGGIIFKADNTLVRATNRQAKLERVLPKKGNSVFATSKEERLQLALDHLSSHPMLTVQDYMRMTGLGRTSATRELHAWLEDENSPITKQGNGTHKFYVLK